MTEHAEFEDLLRRALAPVEPPAQLAERLEDHLAEIAGLAAEELEAWELSAMRDPRNWARPAAALVVGTAAGAALVVLRARQRDRRRASRSTGFRDVAERTVRGVAGEARRLLDEGRRLP